MREICSYIIKELYDMGLVNDLLKLVNGINPDDFMKNISREELYIHFYESFLKGYDPDERRNKGVFYTPTHIVKFIVDGIDSLLINEFGKREGLGDSSVKSLDFATGTGAFLTEMVNKALSKKESLAAKEAMVKDHILQNMYGFETMMPSYIISQIRLDSLLQDAGVNLEACERFRMGIYLTNTLTAKSDTILDKQKTALAALDREVKKAYAIKDKKDIMVIAGNPPYVLNSKTPCNKTTEIGRLLESYYKINGEPLGDRQTRHLRNTYVQFLRYAQNEVSEKGAGVVGVITNHGFVTNNTFRGMRKSLMDTFDSIYILDLHGNSNRSESPPENVRDENVFGIKAGVCISFFVKTEGDEGGACKIFHYDLWGTKEEKQKFLTENSFESMKDMWTEISPFAPSYYFSSDGPDKSVNDEYESFPSMTDIFPSNSIAVITNRDKLAIHLDRETVSKVLDCLQEGWDNDLAEILRLDEKDEKIKEKAKAFRAYFKKHPVKKSRIGKILAKPFDERFSYFDGRSGGLVHRPGEDMRQTVEKEGNHAIAVVKNPNSSEWNHAFSVDKTAMASIMTDGAIQLFPLYLYDSAGDAHDNLSFDIRRYLKRLYKKEADAHSVMGYVHAVLHSNLYRSKYKKSLSAAGVGYPRIPFADYKTFASLASLGNDLIHVQTNWKECSGYAELKGSGGVDFQITKVRKDGNKIHINDSSYLQLENERILDYKIGAARVMESYLKARKGRSVKKDIPVLQSIAGAINRTLEIVDEINSKMGSDKNFDKTFRYRGTMKMRAL